MEEKNSAILLTRLSARWCAHKKRGIIYCSRPKQMMIKKKFNLVLLMVIEPLFSLTLASTALGAENPPFITNRHHPEQFVQSIQNDPEAGKKIYQQFCSTCHAQDPSINVGAPHLGITADWQDRMQKGIDGMLKVTAVGMNQMPPRGGCFECSDVELKQAIIYMLPVKTEENK